MVKLFKWYKAIIKSGEIPEDKVHNISGQNSEGNSAKTPTQMITEAENQDTEFFYALVTLELVRASEKSVYPACPECRKKVEKSLDDTWN